MSQEPEHSHWLRPPRLRTADTAETERHATWFELFFDLVFVLAVAKLGSILHDDPTPTGFVEFIVLFVPVWWAWVIYTFYADRFDTDDVVYRSLVLGGMMAILVMTASMRDVFGAGAPGFIFAYLAVRAIPFLLDLRAARFVPLAGHLTRVYGIGSAIAAGCWLVSLLVPSPYRFGLWVLAVTIELSIPLIRRRTEVRTGINVSHITERFGLFTIIVLGEAVAVVGSAVARTEWRPVVVLAAAASFGLAASFWWLYFDLIDASAIERGFWVNQVFVYGHLPLAAAITAVSAGTGLVIQHAGDATLPAGAGWALGGGTAVYLVSLLIIRSARTASLATLRHPMWILPALLVVAAGVAAPFWPPLATMAITSGVVAVQALWQLSRTTKLHSH